MCTKRLLPVAVRHTALLANRLVRNSKEGYVPPIIHRQRLIKEVYDKFRAEKSFEDYMSFFFALNPPPLSAEALKVRLHTTHSGTRHITQNLVFYLKADCSNGITYNL